MAVLVTGASSGIGAAICSELILSGETVIAVARRQSRLIELQGQLGSGLHPYVQDVTDRVGVAQMREELCGNSMEVSAVVNAAGLALGTEPAHQSNLDEWHSMVQTNIAAVLNVVRTFLPDMVDAGAGDVVNIGSIAGSYSYPGGNVYGATKSFVRHFTLNLRADLAGTGVRATDIQPGLVEGTEFFSVRFRGDKEKARSASSGFRGLKPVDVAKTVVWVLSQPRHVNINQVEIMPSDQGFSALTLHRDTQV